MKYQAIQQIHRRQEITEEKTWNSILQQVNQAVSEYNVDAKKQDLRIEFYVAECGAFPVVGEYHDKIASFEEAIALYEKIPEERMDACKTLIRMVKNTVGDMSLL